jgi:DNA-binding response OmpR family regulator
MKEYRPVILYVENDPNDVTLVKVALEKLKMPVSLFVARDGEQGEAYLEGRGIYADRDCYPWPDLVLMDLKMPRKSGFEVTKWIRAEEAWAQLPIIVLTSSEQPEDRTAVMDAGATAFYIKPVGLEELEATLRDICAHHLGLEPEQEPVKEQPTPTWDQPDL